MQEFNTSYIIPQAELLRMVIPLLKKEGKKYKKTRAIFARKAEDNEFVRTITQDGLETTNTAKIGDFIVKNQTKAGEEYIVSNETFKKKYEFCRDVGNGLCEYQPIGIMIGLEMTAAICHKMNLKLPVYFMAPWGNKMVLKDGDFLLAPLSFSKVYRIARQEFFETYQLNALR